MEPVSPECFPGLSSEQRSQQLYLTMYNIAGDDTLTDPNCFYGLAPWQQEQAMFAAAVAASGGGVNNPSFTTA